MKITTTINTDLTEERVEQHKFYSGLLSESCFFTNYRSQLRHNRSFIADQIAQDLAFDSYCKHRSELNKQLKGRCNQ